MFDGDKVVARVSLSWKNSFSISVVIPHKMRDGNECRKDAL